MSRASHTNPQAAAKIERVKLLVGMEGPTVSRVPGQILTVGEDVDAAEAGRLVDAGIAERA